MPRALLWSQGEVVSYERGTPEAGSRTLDAGRAAILIEAVGRLAEYSTHKAVKAGFWPGLSGRSPQNVLSRSLFARKCEQSSGSNVIPRRARSGLAGLRPHTPRQTAGVSPSLPSPLCSKVHPFPASERTGTGQKYFEDFTLKAKARIWP